MKWSPQQDTALQAASAWLKSGRPQVFRLFGYAGTGKTTLARHLAEAVSGDVLFGAFTGKAAHVMRQRGCEGAQTIHSLIYRPTAAEGDNAEGDGPQFTIRRDAPAGDAALIIIDECSMVDEELGRDLLSFGTPVLVLGDPAQLPPVKGGGFFTDVEPDIMLTEVHRQAADNPIIHLSMEVREGRIPDYFARGEVEIIPRQALDPEAVMQADQVLVGMNKTRQRYNARLRERLGFSGPEPWVGERLVCLRNNKAKGLLNGGMWQVKASGSRRRGLLQLDLTPEDGGRSTKVGVLPECFDGDLANVPWNRRRNADEFDYGYALTVHKAQGSQWDHVLLFDESFAFREDAMKWLYTGITRAARRLTIVR